MGAECRDKGQDRPALTCPVFALNALVMLVLLLVVFGDIIFTPGRTVLSMFGADLSDQFAYTRYFGFQELKQGNFPLWNPHIFSGAPYFGLFQAALLYPFNGIFLLLPLAAAINWSIVGHVFLAGLLMSAWAGYHGRSPLSALLAGIMAMFGGAGFLHIFAGHLSLICALPWAILIFFSLDGVWEALVPEGQTKLARWRSASPWWALGAVAVCLQVLAGHPQTVFVTAVAAGIYALVRVAGNIKKWRLLPVLATMYGLGAVLSAVQLAAGLAAGQGSIREGGVFYKFAAMFSFPPENLLTLVAPGFFGDMHRLPYWGRCYIWETNLFFGVTGFVLLLAGLAWVIRQRQPAWVVTVIVLFILALGGHTPLFAFLYHHLPGFDWFRGSSKFILPAFFFMVMLAAAGFDRIQGATKPPRGLVWTCLGLGLLLSLAALVLWQQGNPADPFSGWGRFMNGLAGTGESYLPFRHYQRGAFIGRAAYLAGSGLLTGGGLLLVIGLLLWKTDRPGLVRYGLFLLATLELVVFARHFRPAFELERSLSPPPAGLVRSLASDERILNLGRHNAGMFYGIGDIWGNNPGVRRRYAELLAVSQGDDPDSASQYLSFRKNSPVFRWLRCGAIIDRSDSDSGEITYLNSPLPRAFLVESYRVITDKAGILAYVTAPGFAPRREVVLEEDPGLPPPAENPGPGRNGTGPEASGRPASRVKIVSSSTDSLVMAVEAPRPAILVVTDTYSRGWRAESTGGGDIRDYRVMPANYALRAIPVSAGRHEIQLVYRPALIRAGLMVSMAGWVLFLVWLIYYFTGRRRRGRQLEINRK